MAIVVVYRAPAMTVEQYNKSWEGGPPVAPPPGLIFHAGVGEGPEFLTVTVWVHRLHTTHSRRYSRRPWRSVGSVSDDQRSFQCIDSFCPLGDELEPSVALTSLTHFVAVRASV